ncbi:glycosyltransferase family 4 protein [Streptomyces sp. SID3343]|uniref:glycosyltransferase family 4 protein n=1 Tax=Streptomyces sp. SID3343 TaxID=2690260 RepID=UPI0031F7DE67
MMKTLIVTNDFPPRPGGIQSFVHAMSLRLPADGVVVYTSSWKDKAEMAAFDAAQPFPVVRDRTPMLVPTPGAVRRAREIAGGEGCDTVWFGAAAPLGLMAPRLRAVGVERLVATTHGHEAGWAVLPGARQLLRRIGEGVDTVTYLGEYTRSKIAPALTPSAAARMVQLPPGVDENVFRPDVGGAHVRARLGLSDRPVVVCVSRLVPRKGQDVLIHALPRIRRRVPDAALLIVGGGPYRAELEATVDRVGVRDSVVFTGAVPWEELPAHHEAGDVFAMPCRTRRKGLDVEGLGIVYLEASAVGRPVVAGDSGGAPDAVLEGETGYVVDGRSPAAVADRVARLLADPTEAARMGAAGRRWVEKEWRWDLLSNRLRALLDPNTRA